MSDVQRVHICGDPNDPCDCDCAARAYKAQDRADATPRTDAVENETWSGEVDAWNLARILERELAAVMARAEMYERAWRRAEEVIAEDERESYKVRAKYDELIYAVARIHEVETRHDTALRYIREAEARATSSLAMGANLGGEAKSDTVNSCATA